MPTACSAAPSSPGWATDLAFSADLHNHVEYQVWARQEAEGTATAGIMAPGIRLAGETYMCRPKSVGSVVEQGRSVPVVELAKSIVSVKSPVRGEVVAVNGLLEAQPELVHTDPCGEGWLARQRRHRSPTAAAMTHHAWLHRQEQGDG